MIRLDAANGVARITLDRPDKLNAFGDDMREQLVEALDRVALTPDARVLVITGAGRAFCAGGDVHHMVALKERGAGFDGLAPLLELGRGIVTRVHAPLSYHACAVGAARLFTAKRCATTFATGERRGLGPAAVPQPPAAR